MEFVYFFFYACLRLRFLDVETKHWPAASCSHCLQTTLLVTLVTDMRHVSELLVPGFGRPVLLFRGRMPRARGVAAHVRDGYGAFRQSKFECGCCEMQVFRVRGAKQNLYMFNLPSDDRIFDCLLTSTAVVQAEDVRTSFLFVGDLNGHHQESFGSTTTNRHGVAAFDFTTVSGCDQLVVGLTHARGGILDILTTDVPDLVWISVVGHIGYSDHSYLSAVISMAQAVPNLLVSRKVFLKHQVTWNTVCSAIQDLPCSNIWSAD